MELLKNIYTFANILSAANTEVVKSWDLSTFTKAVKWADYCIKVDKITRNSIFRDDLDRQIKLMTVMLTPASLLLLSVDKLNKAPYLLYKSLIQNPFTPSDILKEVAEIICCSAEQNISSTQSEKMQSEYRVHQLLGEDVSFIEQNYKTQAVHVVGRLVSLQKICLSRQNRYDQFLESTIKELGKCVCGWNVIIHMILIDDKEEDLEVTIGIQRKILNIVTNMATDFKCGIWRCACSLLLEVSTLDDCFADTYAEYLLSWAQDMVPVYGMSDNGDIYYWRHKEGHMVHRYSYTKLQECVLRIFINDAILKRKVVPVIMEKSKLSYFNIYKDLIRNCKDILSCRPL